MYRLCKTQPSILRNAVCVSYIVLYSYRRVEENLPHKDITKQIINGNIKKGTFLALYNNNVVSENLIHIIESNSFNKQPGQIESIKTLITPLFLTYFIMMLAKRKQNNLKNLRVDKHFNKIQSMFIHYY